MPRKPINEIHEQMAKMINIPDGMDGFWVIKARPIVEPNRIPMLRVKAMIPLITPINSFGVLFRIK